ncbi:hypothetical protein LA66_06900 [Aureimonas altamirensis]|uniref:Uncharacterized protein n=1 Tax=Aureimonas altamirensis TaxID=370622 RepID=A0A0B1QBH0_9HYPH|nr:hypothetical protein [Aureimonas altamirensis]KHJ56287.1 hypothetical protein LA66_06900 [Aureimonas altamirensis]
MNLDDMKQRATTKLEEMDREIDADEAALQDKRRRRHRHQKFIEWLSAGDNELVDELRDAPPAKPVRTVTKLTKLAPAPEYQFPSITPAAASVARQILAEFERNRTGLVANAEKEKLLTIAGCPTKLRRILTAIENEGILTVTKTYSPDDRAFTFVTYKTMEEAAE